MKFYDINEPTVAETLYRDISSYCREDVRPEIKEVLEQARAMAGEVEIRIAPLQGALVLLYCDCGEYYLSSPIPLGDRLDGTSIYLRMADFARRELIPFRLVDVWREELELITDIFPHVDARITDENEDIFTVEIQNECGLLEDFPTLDKGRLSLDRLLDTDADIYYSLLADGQINRYWGYDFRQDNPNATGLDLIRETESEYRRRVALTFAVRYDGYLIGEAVMYDFDYLGSCQIAIRILGSLHGCGIGSETLFALFEIGKRMGLDTLCSSVDRRNAPSLKMCSKFMTELKTEDGKVYFEKKLRVKPHTPEELI